jgi:hypothetical protein
MGGLIRHEFLFERTLPQSLRHSSSWAAFAVARPAAGLAGSEAERAAALLPP